MADDEADIYDGLRAQFPLTFGKPAKSQTPLEAIHKTTVRRPSAAAAGDDHQENSDQGLPSLSSSSKAWLSSLRNTKSQSTSRHPDDNDRTKPSSSGTDNVVAIGPPRPPPDDGDVIIGPPRPIPAGSNSDDDENGGDVMIGPPRPPPADSDDDDNVMIGPPRPPPAGSDSDDDLTEEEEEENGYRIPLSNEIVLKGHTKVAGFASSPY